MLLRKNVCMYIGIYHTLSSLPSNQSRLWLKKALEQKKMAWLVFSSWQAKQLEHAVFFLPVLWILLLLLSLLFAKPFTTSLVKRTNTHTDRLTAILRPSLSLSMAYCLFSYILELDLLEWIWAMTKTKKSLKLPCPPPSTNTFCQFVNYRVGKQPSHWLTIVVCV